MLISVGEYIKDELEERKWSTKYLAYILSWPEKSIIDLVEDDLIITPQMAKELAIAFEVSPEFFTTLQEICDISMNKSCYFKEFKKKKCVGPVPYSIKWKSYENTFSGKRIRKKVTIVACDHKEKPVHIVVHQHLDLGKLIQ